MSVQQATLDDWSSAQSGPDFDAVVAEYIVGSPELPTSIGGFDLNREPSFYEDYAVRYVDSTGQSVRARWSDRHRAFVVRVEVEGEQHGFLRPSGTVGGLLTAGGETIDHGDELSMFEAAVQFLHERAE